jgi:hypothetical protein
METPANSVSNSPGEFLPTGEPSMASNTSLVPSLSASAMINQILALSASIFPGPVEFEAANDPENPSDKYVVFDVVAAGEYVDYRERIFQWHDEVEKLVGGPTSEFRLIVHPKR